MANLKCTSFVTNNANKWKNLFKFKKIVLKYLQMVFRDDSLILTYKPLANRTGLLALIDQSNY